MSAHVEYWGIPSPAEEHYCTRKTDSLSESEEAALSGGRLVSPLNIEHWGEDANVFPNRLSGLVPFSRGEWPWPEKLTK